MSDSAMVGVIGIIVAVVIGAVTWIMMSLSNKSRKDIIDSISESATERNQSINLRTALETGPKITVGMHDADDLCIALTKNFEFINNKPVGAALISYRISGKEILTDQIQPRIHPAPEVGNTPNRTRWEITDSNILDNVNAVLGDQDEINSVTIQFIFKADNGFNYLTRRAYIKNESGRWIKQPPEPDFTPVID